MWILIYLGLDMMEDICLFTPGYINIWKNISIGMIYTRVHTQRHTHSYTRRRTQTHIHRHTPTNARTQIHYVGTHAHTYTYIQIHTHISENTHTHRSSDILTSTMSGRDRRTAATSQRATTAGKISRMLR